MKKERKGSNSHGVVYISDYVEHDYVLALWNRYFSSSKQQNFLPFFQPPPQPQPQAVYFIPTPNPNTALTPTPLIFH